MHPVIRTVLRYVALVCLVLLLLQATALACPTCKEGLAENDPERATLVQGYFWSILFMMSMPFLILAGLGTYFYLLVRKARPAPVALLAGHQPHTMRV